VQLCRHIWNHCAVQRFNHQGGWSRGLRKGSINRNAIQQARRSLGQVVYTTNKNTIRVRVRSGCNELCIRYVCCAADG
jgi:hypothetical protein